MVWEGLATGGAVKGFFPSVMVPPVAAERGLLPEGAPAVSASVGSLSGVDLAVLGQGGAVAEGLPARDALVGPLPGVDLLVLSEVCQLAEDLPARSARVGLLSGVGSSMQCQGGDLAEGFLTVFASQQFLCRRLCF